MTLIPPPHGADMWVFAENAEGVAGYTKSGDILLPVGAIEKCDTLRARWTTNR